MAWCAPEGEAAAEQRDSDAGAEETRLAVETAISDRPSGAS